MELISAHITNFGKIHDEEITFHTGLNEYIHENGWGKTTLTIFIKSMLYGMEHTTSKDPEKNEKLKYAPWQGGSYGGFLIFAHNNTTYRVTRTFSLKKGEDTFELRDIKTNKPSTDFTENLGSELFGVNRETYGRSVHVSLNETPAGSTDISARLNNLIESDDMGNYDQAVKLLDERATALKAKRGSGGKTDETQNAIDACRSRLTTIAAKITQNEEYARNIADLNTRIRSLKESRDAVTGQLALSAKYESKRRYEQLQQDVRDALTAKQTAESFFNGHIPDGTALAALDTAVQEYLTLEANLKNNTASQSEKDQYASLSGYFNGDVPTPQQIDDCIRADDTLKKFRQKESELKLSVPETETLAALEQRFSNTGISEQKIQDYINDISRAQHETAELAKLETQRLQLRNDLQLKKMIRQPDTVRIVLWGVAALALIATVVVFSLFKSIPAAAVAAFAAAACFAAGVVRKPRTTSFTQEEQEIAALSQLIVSRTEENDRRIAAYTRFVDSLMPGTPADAAAVMKISVDFTTYAALSRKKQAYDSWMQEQTASPGHLTDTLTSFVKRYCKTSGITSVPAEIQTLNGKLQRLAELEKKINDTAVTAENHSAAEKKLTAALAPYHTEKTAPFSVQAQEIHTKLNERDAADRLISDAEKKLHAFEADPANDIASFAALTKPTATVDDLNAQADSLTDEITACNKYSADYQNKIDINLSETERKDDIETELERLTAEKKDQEAEHKRLTTTIKLLAAARENLDAQYSDPMKTGFASYMQSLGGTLTCIIDTDLKVSVDDNGQTHDSGFLSEGYKDMVNFCSRMALIDALFTNVRPPVILDDPFVNLDDDKMTRALSLVHTLARDKQILYFACHQSRRISSGTQTACS
jgi:recombinational DNA repair ATPase RecF